MVARTSTTERSPERFSRDEMAGKLAGSQHQGRYLWATQFAAGREVLDAGCGTGYGAEILAAAAPARVLGVDISDDAIRYAASSAAASVAEFAVANLEELPYDADSFDLVVCFEVIEHIEHQERAIAELARVQRPDGLLVISSPNQGVYPPGNPHHTHEFQEEAFERALAAAYANVRICQQVSWLGAGILGDAPASLGGREMLPVKLATADGEWSRDGEFLVALASDAPLPNPEPVLMIGDPFEVGWWQQQVEAALRERDRESLRRSLAEDERDRERREQGAALLRLEAELAKSHAEMARLTAAEAELRDWADATTAKLETAERIIADITGSLSWRLTKALRVAMSLLRAVTPRG